MDISVNVVKGQRLDLTKGNPSLKMLKVGLGWDEKRVGTDDFDLDAFCFALNDQGKISKLEDICYFNQLSILNGAVVHSGDNLTGVGTGDKETITINLALVPAYVQRIVFSINIYEAKGRNQNFGMVSNSYCKCYDGDTNRELMKYDLGEEYSTFEGVVFGEVYRNAGEWKFGAISNGFNGDINTLVALYQ